MVYNEYIALNNPNEAAALCKQYGIDCNPEDPAEVSDALEIVVIDNGEQGLRDVMGLHPDKGVLMDLFPAPKQHLNFSGENRESCTNCAYAQMFIKSREYPLGTMYNATGDSSASSSAAISTQTGVMLQQNTIFVMALLVITAIYVFKK